MKTSTKPERALMQLMKHLNLKFACILVMVILCGFSAKSQLFSSISPSQSTYAPGDNIAVIGIDFFTTLNCDTLQFVGPATYNFLDSIDYTSQDFANDSLFLTLPLDMPCGTYDISLLRHVNCVSNNQLYNFTTITIADAISFDYGDGIFCIGETNPLPNITTTHAVPPVFSSEFGLIPINPATGEIFLATISATTDSIIGTTAGTQCFDTDTFTVTVKPVTQGFTLAYPVDTVCGDASFQSGFLQPIVNVPDNNGVFSSTPTTIVWNNNPAGVIDLVATPPGNYVISYDANPDSCFQTTTFNLTILGPDIAQFDFLPDYCTTNDSTELILPSISQAAPANGVNSGFLPGTGAWGSVAPDTLTGAIGLSGLMPGQYEVIFQPGPAAACPVSSSDIFNVIATPSAAFNYQFDTFCVSSSAQTPTFVATTPGTFFDSTSTGPPNLIVDLNSGLLDIANSSSGGPYSLFHAVDSGGCFDTAVVHLFILDPTTATVSYNNTRFCQNDSNPSPIFTGGLLGGTFISTPVPPTTSTLTGLNPSTGVIDLSASPPGEYEIRYSLTIASCVSEVIVDTVIIDEKFPLDFFIPNLVCEDTGLVPIQFIGSPAGIDTVWFDLFLGTVPFTAQGIGAGNTLNTDFLTSYGNFEMVMTVQEGVCSDTVSHFFNFHERVDPTFEYLDTLLCQNADDPVPFVSGQGGGVFYSLDTGIVINSGNGDIDLNSSLPGAYVIYYNADPICPSIDSDSVVIIGSNQAFFSYASVEPCRDRDSIVVNRDTTFAAGNFTITPGGCLIDSATGTIDMTTCNPGTYSVTHTLGSQSGDCEAIFITEITVSQHDTTAFLDYGQSTYCPSDSLAIPILTHDSTGFFPGQTGLVFDDDSLGVIDLRRSQPGIYYIRFEVDGVCPLTLIDTIEVQEYTSPTFYYGTPSDTTTFYCTTDGNPLAFPETFPGTFLAFTNQRDTVQWVDPLTGEFELDSVTSNVFSPMTICYTPSSGCTFTYCDQLTVNLGPEDAVLSVSDSIICEGDTITFRINGGDSQIWLIDNAPIDSSLSFTPDPALLYDSVEVSVRVGDNQNCNTTIDTNIRIYPVPQVVFTDVPTIVSSNTFVDLDLTDPAVDGVFFSWETSSVGGVTFTPDMGLEGPGLSNQDETVSSLITLDDEESPALIIFTITPYTQQCPGIPVSDSIQVNPIDQPIFVPEVFTPNGDGVNDFWQIQWRQDFDLTQYRMLVYNRSGAEVLDMSPVVPTWDGGTLPDGVYWWKLLNENGRRTLSGGLTIRRK